MYVCNIVLDISMQSALFVPRIILSYVASLSLPYFPTSFHKGQDFLKKKTLDAMCVFRFSRLSLKILSETLLILRRADQDVIISINGLYVYYPLFLPDFNEA